MSASQFYTGLVAELYGPLRSEVPDPAPYIRFVERHGEPALELGCGDGDPILALREHGIDVDGVDSSADMLARCRTKAAERGIEVTVYEQAIERLDLRRRYRVVYLAGPTFNLLTDDETALAALTRIRMHLAQGGVALVPLFIPDPTPDEQFGVTREHVTDDGRVQRVSAVSETRDDEHRLQTTILRYESTRDGGTEVLERPWQLHWHTQDGFAALAKAAGLEVTTIRAPGGGHVAPDATSFVFFLTNSGSPTFAGNRLLEEDLLETGGKDAGDAGPGQIVHEHPAAAVDRARAVSPQRGLVARTRIALVQLEVVPGIVRRLRLHDPVTGHLRKDRSGRDR